MYVCMSMYVTSVSAEGEMTCYTHRERGGTERDRERDRGEAEENRI